jgi:hypothetical protein
MISSMIMEDDPFNPKSICDDLIKRCKKARMYTIRCIIEESWVGIAPFNMRIEDGVFTCYVVAPSRRDAFIQVANKLPVIKFLTKQNED